MARTYFKVEDALPPLAVQLYVRLALLWLRGGFYTDFSVLWTRALPAYRFWDSVRCPGQRTDDGRLTGHMVMHFPARDPVLTCECRDMQYMGHGYHMYVCAICLRCLVGFRSARQSEMPEQRQRISVVVPRQYDGDLCCRGAQCNPELHGRTAGQTGRRDLRGGDVV
jgi:hypothetical protein